MVQFSGSTSLHAQGTNVIVSGQGCFLTDSEGNRFLDAMAGLWCVAVGYGRTEIAEAVYEQMKRLPYYCSALSATTDMTILLAEKLMALVPLHFCSGPRRVLLPCGDRIGPRSGEV